MLKEQKHNNMYNWVTHTWNPVKGKCSHDCIYCYTKMSKTQKPLRLTPHEFNIDLGENNTIFVCSGCDLFAENVPNEWIIKTIKYCNKYNNTYLLQTKNPKRFLDFLNIIPKGDKFILGTTVESNRIYPEMGNTPSPINRLLAIQKLKEYYHKTMVTIEPIMDFDLFVLVELLKKARPSWVNIGANSNLKINLKEPKKEKILNFIDEISTFTKIIQKHNLNRLLEK